MSVITISRGSYSRGREIAENVARRLDYECIGREVLAEASKDFNTAKTKLEHAIEDAPSILDRFVYGKEKYLAYIQKALLHHLQRDRVVYYGPAGHFFVKDIPNVLKIRLVASLEDRIRLIREYDGISRKEALRIIKRLDDQRKKWSQQLYGVYTGDPMLYDLVINIRKNTVDEAVDLICRLAGMENFRTSRESQRVMDDLVLSADIKAALIDLKADIEVTSQRGVVQIKTTVPESQEEALVFKIRETAGAIPGVREIRIHTRPSVPYGD